MAGVILARESHAKLETDDIFNIGKLALNINGSLAAEWLHLVIEREESQPWGFNPDDIQAALFTAYSKVTFNTGINLTHPPLVIFLVLKRYISGSSNTNW